MNNFNVVVYLGSEVNITYYNLEMKGKNVSLHVITERRALRNDINNLLKGDAQGLIERLNSSYNETKTVGSYGVEFTYKPSINGEHVVVITEGNGVPRDARDVKILAVGGFEVVKYRMSMKYEIDDITNTVHINITVEDKPENLYVRYGAVIIKRNAPVTLKITGTNPDSNNFNVSVRGDKDEYQVVTNSDFIKLNASTVEKIIRKVFNDETASPSFSDITQDNSYEISLPYIKNSYIIGVVYDTEGKKIVAVAQESLE